MVHEQPTAEHQAGQASKYHNDSHKQANIAFGSFFYIYFTALETHDQIGRKNSQKHQAVYPVKVALSRQKHEEKGDPEEDRDITGKVDPVYCDRRNGGSGAEHQQGIQGI